jgi:hypothetical protein
MATDDTPPQPPTDAPTPVTTTPPPGPTPRESQAPYFAFSAYQPFLFGIAAGIALRLFFWRAPDEPYTAMMASFILLSPLIVGAVTVYTAELQYRRTWLYYFAAPLAATSLYVIGTLLIMIEGLICVLVILPLFAVLGSLGGLIMGAVCRATNWPKQTLASLAVLPLILGGFEQHLALPERLSHVERSTIVQATPEEIWRHIENARDIAPDEVDSAWMYRIGVPVPHAGVSEATPEGLVRHITMGKGVKFDQIAAVWNPPHRVLYTYRFTPDSFPKYALDDHVTIGGHYFDVRDTEYTLIPRGDATELRVRMGYRVSTHFNFYAEPVARWLIGDFEETILRFYARRAEADGGA